MGEGASRSRLEDSTDLKAGDLVEVRSREEILATLDHSGSLGGLPFMPEMLAFAGQRLRVAKRAHKTCDTVSQTGGRRMADAVHLENIRCDGGGHGGCQAGCLIFWKRAWLKQVDPDSRSSPVPAGDVQTPPATVLAGVFQPGSGPQDPDIRYRCQATELVRATEPLPWWDPRQYVRDVRSGNVTLSQVVSAFAFAGYRKIVALGVGYRALVGLYDWVQRLRGRPGYPLRDGNLAPAHTPTGTLGLTPGEWVRIKSYQDILTTLDAKNKNRGLRFDVEMVPFCGGTYRVHSRVNQIIEEKTGRMIKMKNPCIILNGVYCRAEMSECRLFCPRQIYSYWREIWLERVDGQTRSKAEA
jgi:hypothetical protein